MQPARTLRWCRITAGIGWGAVAIFFLALPLLPFQDLPNHAQVLAVARHLRRHGPTEYVQAPTFLCFGYALYGWLDRLFSLFLSADHSARLLMTVSALALPPCAGRIARLAGGPFCAGVLLGLPLALAWPIRMGFLPYVLALPFLFLVVEAALRVCQEPAGAGASWRQTLLLGALATLCYLAHALVFVFAVGFVGLAWLAVARLRLRPLARLAAAFAPGILLAVIDRARGAFDPIPGTEYVWRVHPYAFRPWKIALAQVVTRAYGISGPDQLVWQLPLLAVLGLGCVLAFRGPGEPEARRVRLYLLLAGLLGTLGTVALPEIIGLAFLLGQRVPVIGFGFLTALAAAGLVRWRWVRLAALAAVALLLATSMAELRPRALRLRAMLRNGPRHQLAGAYLTAHILDCPAPPATWIWGNYHSDWHLWAYALGDEGVTPYLFAYARYLPVWFRNDTKMRVLYAPRDGAANSPWSRPGLAMCEEDNRRRVMRLFGMGARFDGLVVFGRPATVARLAGDLRLPSGSIRPLTDGLMVLVREGN